MFTHFWNKWLLILGKYIFKVNLKGQEKNLFYILVLSLIRLFFVFIFCFLFFPSTNNLPHPLVEAADPQDCHTLRMLFCMKISNQELEEQVLSYRADLRKENSPNIVIEKLFLSFELREY